MRWKWYAVVGVVILVLAATVVVRTSRFQQRHDPPTLVLPEPGQIIELRASLKLFQDSYPAVPEFTVPNEKIPEIMSWLQPADYVESNYGNWLHPEYELGKVKIKAKDGKELHLRFYETGKNPTVFTPNGVDQFWGRSKDDEGRWVSGGYKLRFIIENASKTAARRD